MGHRELRPFVSRREFLRRTAIVGAAAASGPWIWRRPAFAAATPVQHTHLAFGADAAGEMTVSWMTPGPVDAPFVEVAGERLRAETRQYLGYPGWFHHVRLDRLAAATPYEYRIGHHDQTVTPAAQLRTGPRGRAPFRFTAFGDQGTDISGGIPPVSQPPQQASANTELARSMGPALHLIVGDLAYANGDQSIWDDWFAMVEPMARATPWMPCPGNHEIEDQLDPAGDGDGWGEWGYDPYRTRFDLPSNGHDDLANCFYAFRYGSVEFLMLDNNDVNAEITPNIGYTEGKQRTWVERRLAAARLDPDVDFIVVGMHQCAFSSSTKHGSDPGVQAAWWELFARYSVDLVLQGHDHTYERSHAMHHGDVVSDASPYVSDVGTVYVVCGNGGAVQEPFQPVQPAWSAYRQALKVGTLCIDVDPQARTLTLGEYWALDGSPIEEGVVLQREALPLPQPTPGPVGTPTPTPGVPGVGGTGSAPVPSAPPGLGGPRSEPLPATGAPAGVALVGVAALAGAGALAKSVRRAETEA